MTAHVDDSANAVHLLVFARYPELGRVKTRLAAGIGDEAALAVYQELLHHTFVVTADVAAHKTLWLAGPSTAPVALPETWNSYEQLYQFPGDLGQKMQAAFAHAFAVGATAALVIGTDCPGITTQLLTDAYALLETHDVVIGPAEDGGYYLLGMKELYTDLFVNKSWSTDAVLLHTLADADRLGLQVAQLPTLRDVDDVDDLKAWRANTETRNA
ncbi:TIGR04282 family arsenosugar biosynthesis glycosyltransferase [Hymenobacter volaticus]|uniref:TIGR04282 family arsenosugar biosynthesis glycosyltransferase n=1 Tax=Hymenobacter volaticus TaxID=2932254 RepID=A0ABY4GBD6_9BACT|nr:TIGR04282 family arsenosugar biosynthesis glycosyltransferase [Hymenobacter volaticus]UOQ68090.1 TIGR04282 family arsenosugar biosynthesis glycosyltransferase [Hymenobacter volaticus]